MAAPPGNTNVAGRASAPLPAPPVDPLSDLLALLQPNAVFSKRIEALGRWGVQYDQVDTPSFCIVLQGRCVLTPDVGGAIDLAAGDFALIMSGCALGVSSEAEVERARYPESTVDQRYGTAEGTPDFRMLAGAFDVSADHDTILRKLLPPLVHIPASNVDNSRMARLIDIIVQECLERRPGHGDAVKRLMEASLIMIARWLEIMGDVPRTGLLAGLRDAHLAAAIGAMHADVKHGWAVAELARVAGMSRSAFAARFSDAMGCGPLEYLADWRMLLAREALLSRDATFEQVAGSIGFQSASAFSTAFRKRHGCSPSTYRNQVRARPMPDLPAKRRSD